MTAAKITKYIPLGVGLIMTGTGIINAISVGKDMKKLESGEIKKSELSTFVKLSPFYAAIGVFVIIYGLANLKEAKA
jgi:hypothetical protein